MKEVPNKIIDETNKHAEEILENSQPEGNPNLDTSKANDVSFILSSDFI
jgi:hypothetical protein